MANPEYGVKAAVPGDLDAICELDIALSAHLQLLGQYDLGFQSGESTEVRNFRRRSEIGRCIDPNAEDSTCRVARRVGSRAIVGFDLAATYDFPLTLDRDGPSLRTAVTHRMWVSPADRKWGVGTQLDAQVCKWAFGRSAVRMTVPVSEDNEVAKAFFMGRGYAQIDLDLELRGRMGASVQFEKTLWVPPPTQQRRSKG